MQQDFLARKSRIMWRGDVELEAEAEKGLLGNGDGEGEEGGPQDHSR